MKNRIIAVAVVLVALTVAWTVFAAEEGTGERPRGGGFGNMSAEERAQMRERLQNMSEEERAKFREEMRQRFGGRTRLSQEEQLKAIAAMQEQLAKLKTMIESAAPRTETSFRDMPEEERNKLREQMTKARQDRQTAITALRAELDRLSPPRPAPEQMEALRELRAISELAGTEKAAETKKRLDALIAKQAEQMPSFREGRGPGDSGEGRTPRGAGDSSEGGTRRGAGEGGSRRTSGEGSATQ